MKAFLLALGFTLLCACSPSDPAEITGDWHTVLIATDNGEKIDEGGMLFRHIECRDGCHTLVFTFYSKSNGNCRKFSMVATKGPDDVYEAEYEGRNFLKFEYFSERAMAFYNRNVDGDGKVTHMTVLAAQEDHLGEERKMFEELTVEKKIPKENIRNVLDTDNCPTA